MSGEAAVEDESIRVGVAFPNLSQNEQKVRAAKQAGPFGLTCTDTLLETPFSGTTGRRLSGIADFHVSHLSN